MYERRFLTSESVTEGHPDKTCDQISDAVLDGHLAEDPFSRVACETAITDGLLLVTGEITSRARPDVEALARATLRRIGYNSPETGFDADSSKVLVVLKAQSPNIAGGVDISWEARQGSGGEAGLDVGAGDQGMMIGFACTETPELMPLPPALANRLARRLTECRRSGVLPWLLPDGKTQVTVEYDSAFTPKRISAVVVSAHHLPAVDNVTIDAAIRTLVIDPTIDPGLVDEATRIWVNPSGRFEIGGPRADAGLTGRKIIVDTYGGVARHGGGAFSGKDPTKVDRSAAYAARWVAKSVVAAGLASRCEFLLSYAIGVARPTSLDVETFGTEVVPRSAIIAAVAATFDLRPAAIIRDLDLRRPIYLPTAAYGHFGRTDLALPWEDTSRAPALRERCGLEPLEQLA